MRRVALLWIAAMRPMRYVVGDETAYAWAWLGALRILGGERASQR